MRLLTTSCFLFAFCLCLLAPLNGQKKGNPAGATDQNLTEQFDNMVAKSNRYQQYRVVPTEWLNAFKSNFQDSLNTAAQRAESLQSKIDEQASRIDAQDETLATRQAEIEQLNKEKNGISLFGSIVSKTTYNAVVWGLVAALLAGLLFFMGRGRYSVARAREMESSNAELTQELERVKKRRLEVEQELRRKLQDEINKNNQS